MLGDISQGGIGYEGNLLDMLLVISHETEVGRHGSETFPSRECRGIDDKTRETSGFSNVWVDRFREFHKVALLESGLWSHVQNGLRSVEGVFDHDLLLRY
jgi:hypothetical protein